MSITQPLFNYPSLLTREDISAWLRQRRHARQRPRQDVHCLGCKVTYCEGGAGWVGSKTHNPHPLQRVRVDEAAVRQGEHVQCRGVMCPHNEVGGAQARGRGHHSEGAYTVSHSCSLDTPLRNQCGPIPAVGDD